MKSDIQDYLLNESICVNTFEKVVKFAIRKQFFSGGGFFAKMCGKIDENLITEQIYLWAIIYACTYKV